MTPEERLNRLIAADLAGDRIDVLPFWGHRPTRGGVGLGCLSQWWPSGFTVDGVSYPTAEHWMMAGKARLFDDEEGLVNVLAAPTPGGAKAAGRKVHGFDERRWAAERYDIVVRGNREKFGQHDDLRQFLRTTGRRVLVEASPLDRIWGVGMEATHADIARPSAWRGLNLLGFALMEVRSLVAFDGGGPA